MTGLIDQEGFARNLEVASPLGLGLDEKAIEAVKQWRFLPVVSQSQLSVATRIAVDFRLSSKPSRWRLIQVQFDNPPGTVPPVFVNALYPIGAGLGPEAMEEGRLVVAMGRLATARLRFEVDGDSVGWPMAFHAGDEERSRGPGTLHGGNWCGGEKELSASSLADVRERLELR